MDGTAGTDIWCRGVAYISSTQDVSRYPVYVTQQIHDFVSAGNTAASIVCGPKGIGKTILLKLKSAESRRAGIRCFPRDELTERLTELDFSFGRAELSTVSDTIFWQRVWRIVLAATIVLRDERTLPATVTALLGELPSDPKVQLILTKVLDERHSAQALHDADNALNASLGEVQSGLHLFIDGTDELLTSHTGDSYQRALGIASPQKGVLSPEVWHCAQMGFVRAAAAIVENHAHLKIFSGLRIEAFDEYRLADKQNLEAHVLRLQYSEADLEEIFRVRLNELRQANPNAFADSDADDLVQAFFGFTELAHPTVVDSRSLPLREGVLAYLIRHTRGRPRELEHLGRAVQSISPEKRSAESVRRQVRARSRMFFDWAKTEAVPFWDDRIDDLIQSADCNFISATDFARLVSEWQAKHGATANPTETLFKWGVLGVVTSDLDDLLVQQFRQADPDFDFPLADLDSVEHFVFHPVVNLATRRRRRTYVPYRYAVAGHRCGFSLAPVDSKVDGMAPHGRTVNMATDSPDVMPPPKVSHCHFGLGKLGIGLVLPVLATNRHANITVVATSRFFAGLAQDAKSVMLSLKYCDKLTPHLSQYLQLVIVRPQTEFRQLLGHAHCVICIEDRYAVEHLIQLSNTITVSVGEQGVDAVVEALSGLTLENKFVLPFENSEKSISALSALGSRGATVVGTAADRICAELEREDRGDGVYLSVLAETYGEVVIESDKFEQLDALLRPIGDNGVDVHFAQSKTEYSLMRTRKRFLVNGLHFVMASHQYHHAHSSFQRPDTQKMYVTGPFFSECLYSEAGTRLFQEARYFLYRFILLDAIDNGTKFGDDGEVLREIQSLDRYAERVLNRFLCIDDSVARILKPDVTKALGKFETFFGRGNEKFIRCKIKLPAAALEGFTKERWDSFRQELAVNVVDLQVFAPQ